MSDNRFDGLSSALEVMAETSTHFREVSKQIAENLIKPTIEFQKQLAKITKPLAEFQKNIATIVAPLAEYVKIASAAKLLGDNQFVFWNFMSTDLASDILQSEDINSFMLEYYSKNESAQVKETIQSCKSNNLIKPYAILFSQSISAYNRKQNHLAVMGLFGIIDGLLSDMSGETGVQIQRRANIIITKLSDNIKLSHEDISVWFLYSTFMSLVENIGMSIPFNGNEPELLNRHWIMHGRTKRKISQLDCIKMINFIYGILLLDKLASVEENQIELFTL